MKIVGYDPGVISGYVVVLVRAGTPRVIQSGVFELDAAIQDTTRIHIERKPSVILIEDVVQSGYLSKEKVTQIRAHDRIMYTAKIWSQRSGCNILTISPKVTKATAKMIPIPAGLPSQHQKDAYCVALSHLLNVSTYLREQVTAKETLNEASPDVIQEEGWDS